MFPELTSLWWYLPVFLLGSCVGSFLNVVIYRLPLGLSVNHPRRSFCPQCKKEIPWWRNIPILSWLLLRGRCADCNAPIPLRYWLVELITALLFTACWHFHPPVAATALFVMMALLTAISFIDAEHQIIPLPLTWIGVATALASSYFHPGLLHLENPDANPTMWWQGPADSLLGWVLGFFGLWSVVLLGKLAFGKKRIAFDQPAAWRLIDSESDDQPVVFSCDGEDIPWWDLFYRKSDELLLECTEIEFNETNIGEGTLRIREQEITLPDGSVHRLESVGALSGKVTRAVIPREAMGMGDPHLLGMIGAFIGGTGVLFTVCASAFFALTAAILGRIGFGKPLPFGPFLALGAMAWVFGGWKLWAAYLQWIGV